MNKVRQSKSEIFNSFQIDKKTTEKLNLNFSRQS